MRRAEAADPAAPTDAPGALQWTPAHMLLHGIVPASPHTSSSFAPSSRPRSATLRHCSEAASIFAEACIRSSPESEAQV